MSEEIRWDGCNARPIYLFIFFEVIANLCDVHAGHVREMPSGYFTIAETLS